MGVREREREQLGAAVEVVRTRRQRDGVVGLAVELRVRDCLLEERDN